MYKLLKVDSWYDEEHEMTYIDVYIRKVKPIESITLNFVVTSEGIKAKEIE